MYSFKDDYSEGAHPRILEALARTNMEQLDRYGKDKYCAEAKKLLKSIIKRDDADIHFIPGGTQTNLIAVSAFLRPHEAVIAANTGHVLVHETGAIEATGHKIIPVDVSDGKLRPSDIHAVIEAHTDEHMVRPRLVYISNSTEIGTVYRKDELEQLSRFCRENRLLLYMDGARLGSALRSLESDMEMPDIACLTDAFYIGGTKNGALLGEALVICNDSLKDDFRFHMKQRGGMLAKSRILGIQFLELFSNNLYFDLATHANNMAMLLKEGISAAGYKFMIPSPSNQIFPIFPNELIGKLQEKYLFHVWQKTDNLNSAVRLVTSWAVNEKIIMDFIDDITPPA